MEQMSRVVMRWLQAKQQIRVDNYEDRLVSQVAREYTRLMVLNLTNNINKFKYVVSLLLSFIIYSF